MTDEVSRQDWRYSGDAWASVIAIPFLILVVIGLFADLGGVFGRRVDCLRLLGLQALIP